MSIKNCIPEVDYVVLNENTLGYVRDGSYFIEVLEGSVIRGGHNWINGCVNLDPPNMRPATLADFESHRVQAPPNFRLQKIRWSINATTNLPQWDMRR